jgi:uncharacterized protein (TIGR03435 family)
MKDRAAFLAVLLLFAAAPHGQVFGTAAADFAGSNASETTLGPLRFEVASIRQGSGGRGGGRTGPLPGGERFLASNTTLAGLIIDAYRVRFNLVEGGPDWIHREFYAVNGKAERPSSGEELRKMLQNLLAERFKLQFHRETRQLPVYALAVDKNGPTLKLSDSKNAGNPSIDQSMEEFHRIKMEARSVSMGYLVWRVGGFLDRPLIERTELKGEYDFDLTFVEDVDPDIVERAMSTGRPVNLHPTIFEALRQQLGLRLEPAKGLVEVIVVDHAERPGDN